MSEFWPKVANIQNDLPMGISWHGHDAADQRFPLSKEVPREDRLVACLRAYDPLADEAAICRRVKQRSLTGSHFPDSGRFCGPICQH
jgi:hypothetical protein